MWMDVSTTFRNYVDKMISSVGGMKILLLDRETVARVLLCFDLLGGDGEFSGASVLPAGA